MAIILKEINYEKGTKRLISLLTLFVLLLGVVYVPQQAQAANEFYGDYSDTNHDGVSSVNGYTFEKLPLDAPTSAPKYTMRYNANGGTGYNTAGLYSSAYYSRWQFSQVLARRSVSTR